MTENNQIDLDVDLTDEKDEFKNWFKDQINKAIELLNTVASKRRIFLSLNTNESITLETNIRVQNLLRSHKAFDLSIKEPSSPENIIQFLRESIHDLYKKNYDEEALQKIQERFETKDFIDTNIAAEDIYIGFLETVSNFTKWLTLFAQKFPGFHKFDSEDLAKLVSCAALPLYGFYFKRFCKNDDNYLILSNDILYTRERMNLLFDKTLIDLAFVFYKKLHGLNLRESEVALFYPLIMLSCDVNLIKTKEYFIDLKTYYINSLIAEFKANNRGEEFSKKLNDVFKIMVVLEVNKHNFQFKKV